MHSASVFELNYEMLSIIYMYIKFEIIMKCLPSPQQLVLVSTSIYLYLNAHYFVNTQYMRLYPVLWMVITTVLTIDCARKNCSGASKLWQILNPDQTFKLFIENIHFWKKTNIFLQNGHHWHLRAFCCLSCHFKMFLCAKKILLFYFILACSWQTVFGIYNVFTSCDNLWINIILLFLSNFISKQQKQV